MGTIFIFSSVTVTMRVKDLLAEYGFKGVVKKAPAGLFEIGCNYAFETRCTKGRKMLEIILSANVKCGAAYYFDDESYKCFYRRDGKIDLS